MRRAPIISLLALISVGITATAGAQGADPSDPLVFVGTGAPVDVAVPAGVTSMSVELIGARGGDGAAAGGAGALVRLEVPVRPGAVVTVAVGLPGATGGGAAFGGGAPAGIASDSRAAGSGGGATRLWVDGAMVAVAGGGGGGGGGGAVWSAGPDGAFDATPPATPVAAGAGGAAGQSGLAGSDTPTAFPSRAGGGGSGTTGGPGGSADMPVQHTSFGTPGAAGAAAIGDAGGAGAPGAGPGGGGGGGVPGGGGGGAGGYGSAGLDAERFIGGGGGGAGGGSWPPQAVVGTSDEAARATVRFQTFVPTAPAPTSAPGTRTGALPETGGGSTALALAALVAALGIGAVVAARVRGSASRGQSLADR